MPPAKELIPPSMTSPTAFIGGSTAFCPASSSVSVICCKHAGVGDVGRRRRGVAVAEVGLGLPPRRDVALLMLADLFEDDLVVDVDPDRDEGEARAGSALAAARRGLDIRL